ncbi:MAG TPA: antibiotic biosynthesis monooxygenase [Micropepsaceae bacterium]|jgi:heme-degrading monooxygenase HmoA|nr:antibiotic biosynthesis monooxygenase [Micropepsaceae bacterium]
MVVIVFRARMKPGFNEAEIGEMGAHMYGLATKMPGFISYQDYAGSDGSNVTIVEFESHETLKAWREHPEHQVVQKAGRERFFSEYRITVCDMVRDYSFRA